MNTLAHFSPTASSHWPTPSQVAADFARDGFVHIPSVVGPDELAALRRDTDHIIESAWDAAAKQLRPGVDSQDYFVDPLADTGEMVFNRVQYFQDKAPERSLLALLGHPYLLALAHELLGPDFVCAAEALVFKMPGNGREVPIHTDCDPFDSRLSPLIFNMDVYLDDSDLENGCLWAEPGTHARAQQMPRERIFRGLDFTDMIPVPVKAGDVLLHNVRLVHGSPRSQGGKLRRTLYYEFQSMSELIRQGGPRPEHAPNDDFIRDRFRLLSAAVTERTHKEYAGNETPFPYEIPAEWAQRYSIEAPVSSDEVNLRPALGYSKYI